MQHRQLPEGWDRDLSTFATDAKGLATRDASGKVLNAIGKNVPALTARDAEQDNMLEFFDFSMPHFLTPPPLPVQPVCKLGTSPCDDPTFETAP